MSLYSVLYIKLLNFNFADFAAYFMFNACYFLLFQWHYRLQYFSKLKIVSRSEEKYKCDSFPILKFWEKRNGHFNIFHREKCFEDKKRTRCNYVQIWPMMTIYLMHCTVVRFVPWHSFSFRPRGSPRRPCPTFYDSNCRGQRSDRQPFLLEILRFRVVEVSVAPRIVIHAISR